MEALYFLAVGIVLYVVADKVLDRVEAARGARFEHRTVVFFFILLGLGLVTFPILQTLLSG